MMPNARVNKVFRDSFNSEPDWIVVAPGRVNLIGEHTDYNDGFVLPCPINFNTAIAAKRRDDKCVRVIAVDYDSQQDEFVLNQPNLAKSDLMWANYVRGVFEQFLLREDQLCGLDLVISGNVPQGAGLSSSAALEVAVAYAINHANQLNYSSAQLALISQAAENQFVGCNCGIMDQLVSAAGEAGHASLIDCRSLEPRSIPMIEELSVVIVNSNVKRGLVDSEYNTRREQCEQAAKILGVTALRDITTVQLNDRSALLPPDVLKRARHVVSENERVLSAAKALAEGDRVSLSQLMAESHRSMKEDFEITVPAIDYLVSIIAEHIGDQGGVRMTGGGFGGCVVALVPHHMVEQVKALIDSKYESETGLTADIYVCQACDGAGVVA